MLACFALGGWLLVSSWPSAGNDAVASVAASSPAATYRTQAIEAVRLGQRVLGRNPLTHETQPASDIDPATWRAIRLEMTAHGVVYDLAFLRPLAWLTERGGEVGGSIPLAMPEMGLDGPATVVAVEPCPPIEPDDGRGRSVVTGTMRHLAANVLDLSVTGLAEPLGVTDTHPFWSEDRQQFVVAGRLRVGERLRSAGGESVCIARIAPRPGPLVPTYNLEIDGQHVYHVGHDGLLVHNSCPTPGQPPLQRIHSDMTYKLDPEARASLEHWRQQSTQDIVNSFGIPGEELLVKPDGRMMNGNTRTRVLEERGFDINSLPRTILPDTNAQFFPDF
jgi:hypothetical protein